MRGSRGGFASRVAWWVMLGSVAVACESGPMTPRVPRDGDACDGLSYVFYLIALNKDEGDTLGEQLVKARDGVSNPFSSRPEKTLAYWERIIEMVYRQPDASAVEIQKLARASCTVNDRGQAVLIWPKKK